MHKLSTEDVYIRLREKTMLGELKGGERLSEERFARELGVSRTPVREAVKRLVNEGVFEQIPRSGTFVKQLGRNDIEELYDMRAMFEGFAAERAALRITPDQLNGLQILCDDFHRFCVRLRDGVATPADHRQSVLNDVAFHLLILHSAGSERLMKMVDDVKILTNICGRQWISPEKYKPYWTYTIWGGHLRIVRALRKRDAALSRSCAMNHVLVAKEGVLMEYDKLNSGDGRRSASSVFKMQDWPENLRQVIESMERITRQNSGE